MQLSVKFCLVFSVVVHLGCSMTLAPQPSGIFFQQKPLQIMLHTACSMPNKELSDACLGCFWRLSALLQDPENTDDLSDCSSTYLQSTIYSTCGDTLQANLVTSNGTNATAFCDFERCVREVNSKQLISTCILKGQADSSDPVEAYTRTTSCVLCKTHCIDKKFKVQYEYGPRNPALTLMDDDRLKVTVIPYYGGNNEEMCNLNVPVPEHSNPIKGCDCSLPENEI